MAYIYTFGCCSHKCLYGEAGAVAFTLCLPWGQIDPNYIFEKLLLLNRWQQRYETL